MTTTKTTSFLTQGRVLRMALLATAAAAITACSTPVKYDAPDSDFKGRVAPTGTSVVYPGSQVKLAGSNFKPGQEVQVLYQGQSITGAPVVADAEGAFVAVTDIPADAFVGTYPMVVSATTPTAAAVLPFKVSPHLPISGTEQFTIVSEKLVPGLYQTAYSPKNGTIFVTSAVGRPPVKRSELSQLDAKTLQTIKRVSPQEAPGRKGPDGTAQPGGLFAVYGVDVDDTHGNVWVTNTRQNTIAVYTQDGLKLVKQFAPNVVSHPRDVVIDEINGKAFVSAARSDGIVVVDTKTLEVLETITIPSGIRGPGAQGFSTMSLAYDAPSSQLFVVSAGGEVAAINTKTNAITKVFPVAGIDSGAGIAYDAAHNRVLVTGQGSDNLVIADANDGKVLFDVKVGGGSLNVAFDPATQLAYVANRASGTVTVVDVNGNVVANLAASPLANHVATGAEGVVYVVNKGMSDAENSDRIQRIELKK